MKFLYTYQTIFLTPANKYCHSYKVFPFNKTDSKSNIKLVQIYEIKTIFKSRDLHDLWAAFICVGVCRCNTYENRGL